MMLVLALSVILFAKTLEERIDELENSQLSGENIYKEISNWNNYSDTKEKGTLKYLVNPINDSLNSPYFVYIPQNYNPQERTPMIIYFHGGISRPNFPEKLQEYSEQNSMLKLAK